MVGSFLKKYWFPFAVVGLVFAALTKKNHWFGIGSSTVAVTPSERFTEETESSKAPRPAPAVTQMGVLSSDSGVQAVPGKMPALSESAKIAFLKRFGHVAAEESKKFKVPAAVLLATAYVNSYAGKRGCAVRAKNYFALPCDAGNGDSGYQAGGHCFRRYDTAWESFRDFSIFLAGQLWFAEARQIAGKDTREWIKIFATNEVSDVRNFEQEANAIIAAYRLFELDEPGAEPLPEEGENVEVIE